jgi:NAD(P)-dependent dehydrogenase (short-subunit alcohol dehydrogenase family)
MIICKGKLTKDSLKGDVALMTGPGRGIDFEAAKALVCLGIKVVIAELKP